MVLPRQAMLDGFMHRKRGTTLFQLLIDDLCKVPEIISTTAGVCVRIPPATSYEEIMSGVGSELSQEQALTVYEIWCNDAALRDFKETPNGLVITLRETEATGSPEMSTTVYDQPPQAR